MEHLVTLSFVRTVEDVNTDMVVIFDNRDLTQEEVVNRLENHFGEEFSNMIVVTKDQNEIVFRELREAASLEVETPVEDSVGGMMSMMSMLGAASEYSDDHTDSSIEMEDNSTEDNS